MHSFNRIQNRPQAGFRKPPSSTSPSNFERLEQRVLFNADLATQAEPVSDSAGPAIVYEMYPRAADQTPLAPAMPTLRDLDASNFERPTSMTFTAFPVHMAPAYDVFGNDDVIVTRHVSKVWSTNVDQPVESLRLKRVDAIDIVARDIGPVPPSGKGLVLLVEDDAASRNALSTILRRRGWRVETAGTLSEGMRLLDTHPDRVIVDLNLPDGDGGKIVQQLKADGMSSRVTVMTGVSDPARLARVKAMNPGAVLQKPVSVSALLHDLAAADVHGMAA